MTEVQKAMWDLLEETGAVALILVHEREGARHSSIDRCPANEDTDWEAVKAIIDEHWANDRELGL